MTTEELTMMVGAILTSDQGSFIQRIEDATAKIDAHIAKREAALVERIVEEGWIGYQYVDAFRAARRKE